MDDRYDKTELLPENMPGIGGDAADRTEVLERHPDATEVLSEDETARDGSAARVNVKAFGFLPKQTVQLKYMKHVLTPEAAEEIIKKKHRKR